MGWGRRFASTGPDTATELDLNAPGRLVHLGGIEVGRATFGPGVATDPVILAAPGRAESARRGFDIQVGEDGS